MLIVFAVFAAGRAVAEEAQMPGGRHGSVADHATEKAYVAGEQEAVGGGVFRELPDGGDELVVHRLIGVEMQLPAVPERQGGDGPISLRSVVLEAALRHTGPGRRGQSDGLVGAEGVDDMHVVGDGESLPQGCRQGPG